MKTLGTIGLCLATLLAGCSRDTEPQTGLATPAEPPPPSAGNSTLHTVVGGLTGETAVKRGKEARSKIQAIASNEQSALEEAMR